MYKVDWYKFSLWQVPHHQRRKKRMQWLMVLLSEVRKMWFSFLAYRSAKLYDINHTGQVIYLEKALNDAFDNSQRRIYIEDGDFSDRIYVDDRNEPLMLYWRYRDYIDYEIGQEVVDDNGVVYRSLADDNFGYKPSLTPTWWTAIGQYFYLNTRDQYTYGIGFIVYVPVTLDYDEPRMNALIKFRKVAGRAYEIREF